MAYRLRRSETLRKGVRRVADEQLARAIGEIENRKLDRHTAVHQVRKRFKKLRGLLRLVRPGLGETYARENRWYREAGRGLSRVRDVESLLEAIDRLRHSPGHKSDGQDFDHFEERLRARRDTIAKEWTDLDEHLAALADQLQSRRECLRQWKLEGDDAEIAMAGMTRIYRRGRKALDNVRAAGTDERLHEWRKRCKDHWYHLRLLGKFWSGPMEARIDVASELCDLLGDDHDLAMLTAWIQRGEFDLGGQNEERAVLKAVARRRERLQGEALARGGRLFAEKPKCLGDRFTRYWVLWKA